MNEELNRENEPLTTRPTHRDECRDGPRPCPFVGCRYNLMIEVSLGGALIPSNRLSRGGRRNTMLTRWDMRGPAGKETTLAWIERVLDRFQRDDIPSCALDVAEAGGVTLEEVGRILGLTRERVRQLEKRGQKRLREEHPEMADLLLELPEETEHPMETLRQMS